MGVNPGDNPIHTMIATWDWGAYLGGDGIENGIDVMVSSWRKAPPGTLPPLAKVGGGYVVLTLAKLEAMRMGFAEAIMLDTGGHVAEGTGENLFAVFDGRLVTPPPADSILCGITRKSILTLAGELGIPTVEQSMARGALHMADEIFLTGTAAEVTPVRSVDGIPVGKGTVGPVTKRLQAEFFRIVQGKTADRHRWLHPVARKTAPTT
jgi:branched-chain amino acid aminotransferase